MKISTFSSPALPYMDLSVFDIDPILGRYPLSCEIDVLTTLSTLLTTRLVQSPYHTHLLSRYARVFSIQNVPLVSSIWKEKCGALSSFPGEELRPTGLLGLLSLVYFVEIHHGAAKMMNRSNGYPFMLAGVAIVKILCEVFHILDDYGNKGTTFATTPALYWQLLDDTTSTSQRWFQLFSYTFFVLDETFCDYIANTKKHILTFKCSKTILTTVVDLTKLRLQVMLATAPRSVQALTLGVTEKKTVKHIWKTYETMNDLMKCPKLAEMDFQVKNTKIERSTVWIPFDLEPKTNQDDEQDQKEKEGEMTASMRLELSIWGANKMIK